MRCAYKAIQADFVRILDKWLGMYETLDLVLALLFEVLLVTGPVLEARFFNLAQAIEGLCAEGIPFKYETEDKIEHVRTAIMQSIPAGTNPDLREKINSWLSFANDPSLRSYIKKLFHGLDEKLKANVLGEWSEKAFINYVVRARNSIAHPSAGNVWSFTNDEEFRDVMDRMKLLLIVKLLDRAGVPRPCKKSCVS
jgi:hypothetical protein